VSYETLIVEVRDGVAGVTLGCPGYEPESREP